MEPEHPLDDAVRSAVATRRPRANERDGLERRLVGKCRAIRQLRAELPRIANARRRVLISGETGTGKSLLAELIRELSGRKRRLRWTASAAPFEGLRCQDALVQIDDVDRLSRKKQRRLLRALEGDWPADLPLLCISRRPLPELCAEGIFDTGLYYRIAELPLSLPALRERGRADILELAKHALGARAATLRFSRPALNALARHDWPGNVRELFNLVARAALLCDERSAIKPQSLGLRAAVAEGPSRLPAVSAKRLETGKAAVAEGESLKEYFQRFVLKHEVSMSETELAKKLGISRKCLWERRQRLGIPRKSIAERS